MLKRHRKKVWDWLRFWPERFLYSRYRALYVGLVRLILISLILPSGGLPVIDRVSVYMIVHDNYFIYDSVAQQAIGEWKELHRISELTDLRFFWDIWQKVPSMLTNAHCFPAGVASSMDSCVSFLLYYTHFGLFVLFVFAYPTMLTVYFLLVYFVFEKLFIAILPSFVWTNKVFIWLYNVLIFRVEALVGCLIHLLNLKLISQGYLMADPQDLYIIWESLSEYFGSNVKGTLKLVTVI